MWMERVGQVTWFAALTATLIWTLLLEGVKASKCFYDESLGDRAENVYHCNSEGLPRCCVEDGRATCCIDETTKNVEEQLQLWGTVAVMIALIALLFVCCKNDISFCNGDSSLKDQWKNFRAKRSTTTGVEVKQGGAGLEGQYYDNPIGGFTKDEGHGLDPYHYPRTPPEARRGSYHKFDSVFA